MAQVEFPTTDRRRADSPTAAGEQLVLYHMSGEAARVAVVVDELDDEGRRTPVIEDVLSALPNADVHITADRRSRANTPVGGSLPTVWSTVADNRRGWFRRGPLRPATPSLGAYDIVFRIGDRRSRGFQARTDALDLTYILDLEGTSNDETGAARRLGPSLQERCALSSADVVWCGSRRLLATLRQRWQVDANLLYPAAELHGAIAIPGPRRRLLVAGDGISASWQTRLAVLLRLRPDLELICHGTPDPRGRCRGWTTLPPTPENFRKLLPEALAVVMPPSDVFDPRAVWAQEAGVPVIAPMRSAAAETVDGLERRAPTGVLLEEFTDTALADAVAFIENQARLFEAQHLQANARRWSRDRFRATLRSLVFDAWCSHLGRLKREAAEAAAPRPVPADDRTAMRRPLDA